VEFYQGTDAAAFRLSGEKRLTVADFADAADAVVVECEALRDIAQAKLATIAILHLSSCF
jgi:hypothetical protein